MNKRKLTHLVGLSVLLCSVWLPAGIEFSKEKISATSDTPIIETEIVEEDEGGTIPLGDSDESVEIMEGYNINSSIIEDSTEKQMQEKIQDVESDKTLEEIESSYVNPNTEQEIMPNDEVAFSTGTLLDFPLFRGFENGTLTGDLSILPSEFIRLERTENTQFLLNNQVITQDRIITNTTNAVLRITNVGYHDNKSIDAIWTFGSRPNTLAAVTFRPNGQVVFNSAPPIGGQRPAGEMSVDMRHVYSDGTDLPVGLPVHVMQHLSINSIWNMRKEDLAGLFADAAGAARWRMGESADRYLFQRLDLASSGTSFDMIANTPNFNTMLGFTAVTPSSGSVITPYGISETLFDNNSPAPIIEGIKNEQEFKSTYNITQEVGTITNGDYIMDIHYDEALHNDFRIVSIQDNLGEDLMDSSIIEDKTGVRSIRISAESMKNLRTKQLLVKVDAGINKENGELSNYLEEDFVTVPIEVSTNLSDSVITGEAMTWARPWGEGVPSIVNVGETTEDLDPEILVKNLDNKLVGDSPFVVGFEEEKTFDELGETVVNVVIESQISGIQNVIEVPIVVTELKEVSPVDPLAPEIEVNPENRPELPEDQGLVSIDFVSQFNFGEQSVSAQDETYYAKPQRLLDGEGTLLENGERPNYIQISDRRGVEDRGGWQLVLRQEAQFSDGKQDLVGAQIRLQNAEVVTAQQGIMPSLVVREQAIIPEESHVLLETSEGEGTGTWVYRFGNSTTAGESVALDVPREATPDASGYQTKLNWVLSAVPANR